MYEIALAPLATPSGSDGHFIKFSFMSFIQLNYIGIHTNIESREKRKLPYMHVCKLSTPSSVAPDCFTLFLVFSYGLDVGSTALSSNSRHPVVVTAPSEWPRALKFRKSIFRETRAASPITTKEFDFKKDRHTRGLIHWSEITARSI